MYATPDWLLTVSVAVAAHRSGNSRGDALIRRREPCIAGSWAAKLVNRAADAAVYVGTRAYWGLIEAHRAAG